MRAIVFIFTLLTAFTLSASGGETGFSPYMMLLFNVINFGIFAYIVFRFGWKPIKKTFEDREKIIREELEKYKASYELAENEISLLKNKIDAIEEEKGKVLAGYEKDGDSVYSSIINKAKKDAERMRKESEIYLHEEITSMKEKILKDFVEKLIAEVERSASSLDASKKESLKKEFIQLIGTMK